MTKRNNMNVKLKIVFFKKCKWTSNRVFPPFLFHVCLHIHNVSNAENNNLTYQSIYFILMIDENKTNELYIAFILWETMTMYAHINIYIFVIIIRRNKLKLEDDSFYWKTNQKVTMCQKQELDYTSILNQNKIKIHRF